MSSSSFRSDLAPGPAAARAPRPLDFLAMSAAEVPAAATMSEAWEAPRSAASSSRPIMAEGLLGSVEDMVRR